MDGDILCLSTNFLNSQVKENLNYLLKLPLACQCDKISPVMSRLHFLSPKVLGSNDSPVSNCHLIADNSDSSKQRITAEHSKPKCLFVSEDNADLERKLFNY